MDINFQDRIDQYLLHKETMSEVEKVQFLKELEEDVEKKSQFDLTVNLRTVIKSREDKLKEIVLMQLEYDDSQVTTVNETRLKKSYSQECNEDTKKPSKRKNWIFWLSGIAAVVALGFFMIKPVMFVDDSVHNTMRGDSDEVFDAVPCYNDTIEYDTLSSDTMVTEFIVQP